MVTIKISKTKKRTIPRHYLPKGLSRKDRKKQLQSIIEGKNRPKNIKSYKSKRSKHVIKFEKKYGKKITDTKWISRNLLKKQGILQILNKGRAAYYTSGSRPLQTKDSWAYARLASVLTNGPAAKPNIDGKILEKYKLKRKLK